MDIVRPQLPEGGKLVVQTDRDDYVEEVGAHAPVDVVVIDGRHRPDCIEPALDALSDEGVVVLDDYHLLTSDADYPYDVSEYDALLDSEFRVLPFYGPKALSDEKRCTAVCYRPENCLSI